MNNLVTVKNLTKKYGLSYGLNNVSLNIATGEVVVIIGPSGGGKSTLLRTLIQLEKIDAGEIYIEKICVARPNNLGKVEYADKNTWRQIRRKMGMVFQNFPLFPHKTVLENLTMASLILKNAYNVLSHSKSVREISPSRPVSVRVIFRLPLSSSSKLRLQISIYFILFSRLFTLINKCLFFYFLERYLRLNKTIY